MWTEYGIVTVKKIPKLGDLTVECDFAVACDGSGAFAIMLKTEIGSYTSFSVLGMDFSIGDIAIGVSHVGKQMPLNCIISRSLSGIDNLCTSLSFDLPFFQDVDSCGL